MGSDGALGVRVAGRRRHRLGSLLGTCTCDRGAVGWGRVARGGASVVRRNRRIRIVLPNEPTWRDVTGAARWPPYSEFRAQSGRSDAPIDYRARRRRRRRLRLRRRAQPLHRVRPSGHQRDLHAVAAHGGPAQGSPRGRRRGEEAGEGPVRRRAQRRGQVGAGLLLWGVLVGSTFVVLKTIDLVFGDSVSLGGFVSVTLLILTLLLSRLVVRRLLAPPSRVPAPAG